MSSATSGTSIPTPTRARPNEGTRHGGASVHSCKPRKCYVQYPHSKPDTDWCAHCGQTIYHPPNETPVNHQSQEACNYTPQIPPLGQAPLPHFLPHPQPYNMYNQLPPPHMTPPFFAMPPGPGISRPHPMAQAQPLHDLGFGPTPLFGWASVTPRAHTYGQPKFWRHTKPNYRRFCFPVGKADVPYASLPGGPLEGFPAHMTPQLVGRW